MVFGIIVFIIGVIVLLENLGVIAGGIWTIFWPGGLLVLIGLALIFRRRHCCWYGHHHHGHNRDECCKHGDEMKDKSGNDESQSKEM